MQRPQKQNESRKRKGERELPPDVYLFRGTAAHVFQRSDLDSYWKLKLPITESIHKSVKILTDACGLSLTVREREKGWLGIYPEIKEVIISPRAISLLEKYAAVEPAFVECGLKWCIRHEYWHTKTNPMFVNKIIIRDKITFEKAIAFIERQVNKKLFREIVGQKYKTIELSSNAEKWELRLIATGITFPSVISSGKEPSHWVTDNCYVSISNYSDIEFSFFSTKFDVLLNRALKEVGDEITCMAFRQELRQEREKDQEQ